MLLPAQAVAKGGGSSDCKEGWCSLDSKKHPFTVWTKGDGKKDDKAQGRAVSLIDSLWKPETALMGPPLPDKANGKDDGNDSRRTDFYVVGVNEPVTRSGKKFTIAKGGAETKIAARTIDAPSSAKHDPPKARSAFVLLRSDALEKPKFRSDAAHELFHALQYAHNALGPKDCPGEKFWFTEASATWAESYFVPATAEHEVYSRFGDFQDGTDWGLQDTGPASGDDEGEHPYDSFIWPYFMQQEAKPSSIANAYRAMESAKDCGALMKAVDKQLPFATHFRDFALRNLNTDLFGDDLKPINPRYTKLHDDFPEGILPNPIKELPKLEPVLSNAAPTTQSFDLPSLRAGYAHAEVSPDVRQLKIDPSGLSGAHDVDAVVLSKGKWSVRHLDPGSETTICTDQDPVSEMYLVISNHSLDRDSKVKGDLKVRALGQPCDCPDLAQINSYSATASVSFDSGTQSYVHSGETETARINHSGSALTAELASTGDVNNAAFAGPMTGGSLSFHDVYTDHSGSTTYTQNSDGGGLPDSASADINVQFDLPTCTYQVAIEPAADVTLTDSLGGNSSSGDFDSYLTPAKPIPASLNLSGVGPVTVFVTPPPDRNFALGEGSLSFDDMSFHLLHVASQGSDDLATQLGNANLSWNLVKH